MKKIHYKLYKKGKNWCYAIIVVATVALATTFTTAKADMAKSNTLNETQTVATLPQSSDISTTPWMATNQTKLNQIDAMHTVNSNYGYLDQSKITFNRNSGEANLHVSGWHVNGQSDELHYRYAILYDNTVNEEIKRQKIESIDRPDVKNAYPNVVNSNMSGFQTNFILPNNIAGHKLSIVTRYSNNDVDGEEGRRADYWFEPIIIDNGNEAYLDSLTSDASGMITVSGWHATNQAFGRSYHFVIAFDISTGYEIARQQSSLLEREDVQKAYPGIANATLSGFNVKFRLAPIYAQDTIQFISRWTDSPDGNGNYVDYWFDPVKKINRGWLDSWDLSSGKMAVSGWHADDASLYQPYHYLILFDSTTGQQVAAELVPMTLSEDILSTYPDTRSAGQARFNYLFNSDYKLISGHTYHLVSRYSVYNQGNGDDGNPADYTDYWFPSMTLNQRDGYLDSYNINFKNQLHIVGWMANDDVLKYPFASIIILTNNNRELARQSVMLSKRPDVAYAKPTILRSLISGFDTAIQLPSNAVNGDLQIILRFSDGENGEGNYSDFWLSSVRNGLRKNRVVKEGNQLFYYDNQGRQQTTFLIDGVLYKTDDTGKVLNSFVPDRYNIGNLTFTGELTGISKDNRRPVKIQIAMKNGTVIDAWATVKWQGNSTLIWPKKSYRLKLFKDENLTNKLKIKLPGSGLKTNSFNLKACFMDPTAGLNIVNANLFSKITKSRPNLSGSLVEKMPNYGQVAGIPLELGINGLDQGLYVLETYQEDKLYNLDDKKEDNYEICGNLYTPVAQFMQKPSLDNFMENDFEVKSPVKFNQSGVAYFNKLYRLANCDENSYFQLENQYLDVPSVIDYLAFSIAINSTDSFGKNITYISKNGSKWFIMPYDLDTTWDNNFDGTLLDINNNITQSLTINRLLETVYNHHRSEIISRYSQLRQSVLSTANVINQFNKWFDQVGSDTYNNNDKLWGDINLPGQTHRLSISSVEFDQMIAKRLAIVDQQLGLA